MDFPLFGFLRRAVIALLLAVGFVWEAHRLSEHHWPVDWPAAAALTMEMAVVLTGLSYHALDIWEMLTQLRAPPMLVAARFTVTVLFGAAFAGALVWMASQDHQPQHVCLTMGVLLGLHVLFLACVTVGACNEEMLKLTDYAEWKRRKDQEAAFKRELEKMRRNDPYYMHPKLL